MPVASSEPPVLEETAAEEAPAPMEVSTVPPSDFAPEDTEPDANPGGPEDEGKEDWLVDDEDETQLIVKTKYAKTC